MSFRCYWCDSDQFKGVNDLGEVLDLQTFDSKGLIPKDYVCAWCGHLVSEGDPRNGDPEETVDTVKDERDELRAQLEQCMGEQAEARVDRVKDNSIESNT